MARWHMHYGRYWMVQWCWDGWLSLGVHLDTKRRVASVAGEPYGPYVDLHLGPMILSVGYRPYWSSGLACDGVGRGGERAD